MYRIVALCRPVLESRAAEFVANISEEFSRRPWHQNVSCKSQGDKLVIQADNDGWDLNGLAFMDEFSDAICACIESKSDIEMKVVSITHL